LSAIQNLLASTGNEKRDSNLLGAARQSMARLVNPPRRTSARKPKACLKNIGPQDVSPS
jgi:hypothetical protein